MKEINRYFEKERKKVDEFIYHTKSIYLGEDMSQIILNLYAVDYSNDQLNEQNEIMSVEFLFNRITQEYTETARFSAMYNPL